MIDGCVDAPPLGVGFFASPSFLLPYPHPSTLLSLTFPLQRIKLHFRDIAARPIAKVAEARARKRRRVSEKLEKAKKAAESILDQEELGARSKNRAIAKVYRQAEASKKRKVVYAVHTNKSGRSMRAKGGSGGGGGTVVKHVDGRMKKEKRALKRKGRR